MHDRAPHAVLDAHSRRVKALKIERVLGLAREGPPIRLLEIGTGSAGIAAYFANHRTGRFDVDAVDVVDQRQVDAPFRFTQVHDTALPFPEATFDVVISNQVIEHVGDTASQRAHLESFARVLKPDGVGYFAGPNRWTVMEAHYRLPFLSWLPRSLRTPYLKVMGKGTWYDCEPLTLPETEALLREAGLAFDIRCIETFVIHAELELPRLLPWARRLARAPVWVRRAFESVCPTLVYVVRRI